MVKEFRVRRQQFHKCQNKMWGDSHTPRGRDEWVRGEMNGWGGSTSWCLWCLPGLCAASSLVWLQVTRYMHSHQGIRTSEFIRNSVSVNCIRLLVILWTVVCQAPPGILHGQNTGGDNTERMSGAVSQYDFILGGFPGGPVVRLCTPNAGVMGSTPGWGTKIPCAVQCG